MQAIHRGTKLILTTEAPPESQQHSRLEMSAYARRTAT